MNNAIKPSPIQIRISGYRILHEVGRGGVATVYLAIQESLQRQVVLKVMSPALTTDPNFTERFIYEGRTIARLNHPGIVTIYDISADDYHHYIAMEYLPGDSLKQRIKNRLDAEQALDVIYQIAAALEFAHDKGIVHRDVKPENIMFRDAGGGEAVLTDFGIAKSSERDTQLTSVGMVVGTPRYMSPEQAEGKGATARSDIYSLGIILYEMLTGLPPYRGKESLAVLYSHINDPIPQLPEKYLYLQSLFESMVAKDPSARIGSCTELLQKLEGFHENTARTPLGAASAKAATRVFSISSVLPSSVAQGVGAAGRYIMWGGVTIASVVIISTVISRFLEPPAVVFEDDLPEGKPPLIVTPTKIDLTGDSRAIGAAADSGQSESNSVDIDALLNLALKQVESNRLSTPAGNNALDTYRAILKIEPGNAEAEQGLDNIAGTYEKLAHQQIQAGNYEQAAPMVRGGLAARPGQVELLKLSRQIDLVLLQNAKRAAEEGADEHADNPVDKYVKALAEDNYAEAQFQTGMAFANGDGVERDLRQALHWMREAAGRNHVEAQYSLALGLLFGPEPDYDEAARLMRALGERGYKPAYRVLGWMYTTGTGMKKRVKPAVQWSARATTWGEPLLPSQVVEPWQRAFEEQYQQTVARVSDQELRLPENLK